MAEKSDITTEGTETFVEKGSEEIHARGSSSYSSSDSEVEKPSTEKSSAEKPSAEKPSTEKPSRVYRLFGREKPVHKVLGGGKPADVFLWRNKKVSGGALSGATAMWILFELMDYHLLTLICHIVIASLAVLFLWANVTHFIHKSPPRIPEIHLKDEQFQQVARDLRNQINWAFSLLHDVASGRDLKTFLSVMAGLWVLSIVGSWCNFFTLFYIVFVLLHTVPALYEKYEDKVDLLAEKAMAEIRNQYAVFDAKVLSKVPRRPLKNKKA